MKNILKRTAATAFALAVLGTGAAGAAGAAAREILIGGEVVGNAIESEGAVFVPLRAAAEALGCTVEWDDGTETVTLSRADGVTCRLTIGRGAVELGEAEDAYIDEFECAPILVDDARTYIPLEYFETVFGEKYSADGEFIEVAASAEVTVAEKNDEERSLTVSDPVRGEVIVFVTEETEITEEGGAAASFEDIEVGAALKAYYSGEMTMSLPPQTTAAALEILKAEESKDGELTSVEGQIIEISAEDIVISTETQGKRRLALTEQTRVRHYKNKR